jgi:hypothetical protein
MRSRSALSCAALLVLLVASPARAQGVVPADRPRVTTVMLDSIGDRLAGLELERIRLLVAGRVPGSVDVLTVEAHLTALRTLLVDVAPASPARSRVRETVRRALEDRLAGVLVWQRVAPITRSGAPQELRALEAHARMLREPIAALASEP